MKTILILFTLLFSSNSNLHAQKMLTLIENRVFYDGYAKLISESTKKNILRQKILY